MFGLFAALFLFTPTPSALKRNQGGLHDWLITDAFLIWSSVRPLMVCYRGKMKIPNWTPCTTFIFRRCVWNSLSSKFKQLADDSSPEKAKDRPGLIDGIKTGWWCSIFPVMLARQWRELFGLHVSCLPRHRYQNLARSIDVLLWKFRGWNVFIAICMVCLLLRFRGSIVSNTRKS